MTTYRHYSSTRNQGAHAMNSNRQSRKIVEIEHGHENDPVARSHALTAYTVIAVIASIGYSFAQGPMPF